MGTIDLAHEFAGIAAQEITGRLCLADTEAFQLIRDCITAAILGTIIRQRRDSLGEKRPKAAGALPPFQP